MLPGNQGFCREIRLIIHLSCKCQNHILCFRRNLVFRIMAQDRPYCRLRKTTAGGKVNKRHSFLFFHFPLPGIVFYGNVPVVLNYIRIFLFVNREFKKMEKYFSERSSAKIPEPTDMFHLPMRDLPPEKKGLTILIMSASFSEMIWSTFSCRSL